MNSAQDLEAYLKIVYQNLTVLHHNMTGHGFYVIHPMFGEFYDKVGEINDALIEREMLNNVTEPSIKDAVLAYNDAVESVEPIDCNDALNKANDMFTTIITKMMIVRGEAQPDLQSMIDGWVSEINVILYKIKMFNGSHGDDEE